MTDNNYDDLVLRHDAPQENEGALPRARQDVEITEQVYFGKPCYILKDPTSLRYYRLRPPEYTIYQMLDGKNDMETVLRVLTERFPNDEFDAQAVMNFLIMLRGANLLQTSGENITDYLLQRKEMLNRGFFKRLRQEFLFYRIPLLDPDKLLNFLRGSIGKLIFNNFAMVLTWLILLGAIILLVENIDKLGQRQPLLSWINLLYLGPALLMIKFIHEFGHGLTAKYFDTEVHEMGILFLVFMPCFYCDVSDAWMLSEKRKRMWITAAGIVVEIILAALATYVWAFTAPKTIINQFALNVMVAASINTILFNGNPLLRYDGYYFMMDLVEIPNLKQKGTSFLWYLVQRYVLGDETAAEPIDVRGREFTILGYAVCSAVYRWFIMIAIITMVWKFLDPYGWGVIGGIMALGCIYTSFFVPIGKFFKYIFTKKHQLNIRIATAVILVLSFGGLIYGVMIQKVEQTVDAQCILRPRDMHPIYVTQPGFINAAKNGPFIQDGDAVQAGQVLLRLSEPQLEFQVKDLELQVKKLELQKRRAQHLASTSEEVQFEVKLKGLQKQLSRARHDLEKLTLRSPIYGVVQLNVDKPLAELDGTYLPLQTRIFTVYKPGHFEAIAAVNLRDIEFIHTGDNVQIKLWSIDNEIFDGHVAEKPSTPVEKMSSPAFSTVFHGEVPTMPASNKLEAVTPADTTFEMVLAFDQINEPRFRDGMVGRAKILIERKSLAKAFYLWFIRTLKQDIRL